MATAIFDSTFVPSTAIVLDDVWIARAALKTEIKTDTTEIRAAKHALRILQRAGQGAGEMAALYQQRQNARARLALYAFLRGRTWAQFEPNHAEECKINLRIFSLWKKLSKTYPGVQAPETLRAVCPAKWFEVKA